MQTLPLPDVHDSLVEFLRGVGIDVSVKKYSEMTDEQLLEELKKSSEFDKFVFPNHWYSKFELPEKKCMNMREFIRESPWMRTSQHWYIGKEEIPAKPGGLRPVLPAPEVPTITVIKNSFSDANEKSSSTPMQELVGFPCVDDGLEMCSAEPIPKKKTVSECQLETQQS